MNKNETKYLNTARLMNEALLLLLEKKNYEFITVKEICEKAGVNRSTFYLHYETMDDLLGESIEYILEKRNSRYSQEKMLDKEKISNIPLEDLVLITPTYIVPYLEFVKENKRIFSAVLSQPKAFRVGAIFDNLFNDYITHIMARFDVPEQDRRYMLTYYMNGMNAVVMSWVKGGCREPVEYIADFLIKCVRPYRDVNRNE